MHQIQFSESWCRKMAQFELDAGADMEIGGRAMNSPSSVTVRIPEAKLNYWADQFIAHGLVKVMTFGAFIDLPEARRRRFVALAATPRSA